MSDGNCVTGCCAGGTAYIFSLLECTPLPSLPILFTSEVVGLSVRPPFKNMEAYQRIAHESFLPALKPSSCFQKFMVPSMENWPIFFWSNCFNSTSTSGSKSFHALAQVAQPQLVAARKKKVCGKPFLSILYR